MVTWIGGAVLVVSVVGCLVQSATAPIRPAASTNVIVRSFSTIGKQFSAPTPALLGVTVTGVFAIAPSPSPSVVGYRLWWGAQSQNYTNSFDAKTNLTVTLTNLLRGVKYYAAATGYDTNGNISPFSQEVIFPASIANYVTPFVETAASVNGPWTSYWSQTFTNPPASQQLFRLGIRSTNSGSVVRLDGRTLQVVNTNNP